MKNKNIRLKLFSMYLNRGNIYFIQGSHDKAIADYEAASKVLPEHSDSFNNLGFVYYEKNEIDKAIDQWKLAIDLDLSNEDAWAGLAIALFDKGNREEAIKAYQQAFALEPRYSLTEWLKYERYWTEKATNTLIKLIASDNRP